MPAPGPSPCSNHTCPSSAVSETPSFLPLWPLLQWFQRPRGPYPIFQSVNISVNCSVVSDSLWPLWTVARQTPLSMGFSKKEYWSGLPCPPPGDFSTQESNLGFLHCKQILYHLSQQGGPVFGNTQHSCHFWRCLATQPRKPPPPLSTPFSSFTFFVLSPSQFILSIYCLSSQQDLCLASEPNKSPPIPTSAPNSAWHTVGADKHLVRLTNTV